MSKTDMDVTYVYPSPARCPRCKGYDTVARRTDNERGIQYRLCRRAICRWNFSVRGTAMPRKPEPGDFACPFCGQSYARKNGLTRHINSKHPEKGQIDDEEVTQNAADPDAVEENRGAEGGDAAPGA